MAPQENLDVLHVIGSLAAGGAERNLYYLAPSMARSSFRYGICCLIERGEFADEVEAWGIPVFALGYRKRSSLLVVIRLCRLLRRRRVKIVHTHLFDSGVIGRLAAWLAGVPVIITHEHGKTTWKKWYHRWFERLAVHGTDLRIAVSEDIRSLRLKHEHTPAHKIVVVGNAVEASRFEPDGTVREIERKRLGLDGFFLVGTVGRLVVAKSYDLLLRIAGDVCARRPEARFVLVGEGPLREDLVRLHDSLGLAQKVILLGAQTDIPDLLAAFDLYVITSQREGLPISLIEAMMAAKPIVATAVGGIPEALANGEDGLLVESGDKAAFVDAVLALMDDPAKGQAMGERARTKALARYSAQAILETLESIYKSILARKGVAACKT